MTKDEQLYDVLQRMKFLQSDAQRLHDIVVEQGFRTEEQAAEIDMLSTLNEENEREAQSIAAVAITAPAVETVSTCRHCGKPVERMAGLWRHINSDDFAKCGRAGVPRNSRGEI